MTNADKIRNMTDEVVELMGGEKIMQGIFTKYLIADNDNATKESICGTAELQNVLSD